MLIFFNVASCRGIDESHPKVKISNPGYGRLFLTQSDAIWNHSSLRVSNENMWDTNWTYQQALGILLIQRNNSDDCQIT